MAFGRFGLEAQRFLTNLARESVWELRLKCVLDEFVKVMGQPGCREGGTSRHVTPRHPTSHHIMSRHVLPRHPTPHHPASSPAQERFSAYIPHRLFTLVKKMQLSSPTAEAPAQRARALLAVGTETLSFRTHRWGCPEVPTHRPVSRTDLHFIPSLGANTHTCNTEN